MTYRPIVSVGFNNGEPDLALSLEAAELTETQADEIRQWLAIAARRFDEMRREFYPRVIQGGRLSQL